MKKFLPLFLIVFAVSVHAAATVDPATVLPKEWTAFRFERTAFLRTQPNLAAQQKSLDRQISIQQANVEAAMVRANPAVAPVLKRLNILLKKGWRKNPFGVAPLTTADWQLLRSSRDAAFKANPNLAARSRQLMKQKSALDGRIDAAFVKGDASAAGFVSGWPAK